MVMTRTGMLLLLLSVGVATVAGLTSLPKLFENQCMAFDPYGYYHHPFFNESGVGVLSLEMSPESLRGLQKGNKSGHYYPTSVRFASPAGRSFEVGKAGIRVRGWSSRYFGGSKQSFTVDLRRHGGSPPWGLDKIALRAEPFDPTVMREFLTMDILRAMGVCVARKSYMRVEINGAYAGLYVIKEVIEAAFLVSRYGMPQDAGMLFKLPGWTTIDEGQTFWFPWQQYQTFGKTPLKMHVSSENYASLVHLTNILTYVQDPTTFAEMMSLSVDIPLLLRYYAAMTVAFSYDSLPSDGNNWYLALNTEINQLRLIPTDFDLSIGWNVGLERSCMNPYRFSCFVSVPLYDRVLDVPEFRDLFTLYTRTLINELATGSEAPLVVRMQALKAMIVSAALAPFANDSTALFGPSSFLPGFNTTIKLDADVIAGIQPWLESYPAAVGMLLDNATAPVTQVSWMWAPVYPSTPQVPVVVVVHSDVPVGGVVLQYTRYAGSDPPAKATMPLKRISDVSNWSSTWKGVVPMAPAGTTMIVMRVSVEDVDHNQIAVYPPGQATRTSLYPPPTQSP